MMAAGHWEDPDEGGETYIHPCHSITCVWHFNTLSILEESFAIYVLQFMGLRLCCWNNLKFDSYGVCLLRDIMFMVTIALSSTPE